MINDIIVSLPYPFNFFGLVVSFRRKVGFRFTNYSIFLFREEHKIENSKEYEKWIKENGEAKLFTEMMYFSAVAWCHANYKKQNFTREKLIRAISTAPHEDQQRIIEKWKQSQSFGAHESKKKAVTVTK
jgi:hypothetical protein